MIAELLTKRELARTLSCSSREVDRLLAAGRIGPRPIRLRPGGHRRWDRGEVAAWIRTRRPDGTLPTREDWAGGPLELSANQRAGTL